MKTEKRLKILTKKLNKDVNSINLATINDKLNYNSQDNIFVKLGVGILLLFAVITFVMVALCLGTVRPKKSNFDNPTFIWNDDLEALPSVGSSIIIEDISNDTIYLSSYN